MIHGGAALVYFVRYIHGYMKYEACTQTTLTRSDSLEAKK